MRGQVGTRRVIAVASIVGLVAGFLAVLALVAARADASDNVDCPAGTTSYKWDTNVLQGLNPGQSASKTIDGETFTVTKVAGPSPFVDDSFTWSATTPVVEIIVKGGVDSTVKTYSPPASADGTALHPPLNSGNQPPTISHIVWCSAWDEPTTTTTPTTLAPTTTTDAPTTTTTDALTTTAIDPPTTTTTVGPKTTTSTEVAGATATLPTTTTAGTPQSTVWTQRSAPSGSLPSTGSNSFGLTTIALVLLAGGVTLILRNRRSA